MIHMVDVDGVYVALEVLTVRQWQRLPRDERERVLGLLGWQVRR
jgi:hypothetical protein